MIKTLEEIKDQVAKEIGFKRWDDVGALDISDNKINQIAQSYAQSQTQELKEQNAELVEMLSLVCMDLEERGRAYGDAYNMSKELLTKHNQLKSNTNG